MSKYYVYDNATRRFKVGEFTFAFDVVEQFAGNWRGVLKLDKPEEIAALETFAATVGVREITADAYEELLKKKGPSRNPSQESITRLQVPIKGSAGAAVVRDPSAPTISNPNSEKDKLLSADDAVVLGDAPYVDPLDVPRTARNRKKKAA